MNKRSGSWLLLNVWVGQVGPCLAGPYWSCNCFGWLVYKAKPWTWEKRGMNENTKKLLPPNPSLTWRLRLPHLWSRLSPVMAGFLFTGRDKLVSEPRCLEYPTMIGYSRRRNRSGSRSCISSQKPQRRLVRLCVHVSWLQQWKMWRSASQINSNKHWMLQHQRWSSSRRRWTGWDYCRTSW